MDKMKRKAQFSNTMTTILVLLVLVVLMALFLIAAYWTSHSKSSGRADAFAISEIRSSILTKQISIDKSQKIVLEHIVSQYKNGDKFAGDEFKLEISNIMLNDASFSGKESCAFFSIGGFQNFDNLAYFYLSNPQLYESVLYYKSADNEVKPYSGISDINSILGVDKLSSFAVLVPFNANSKQVMAVGYYGGCAND